MKKVVKLNEYDLHRIVERVIEEGKSEAAKNKKEQAIEMLKKISTHLRRYNVEKEEFATADMNYLVDMFEKIMDNQDIKS